MVINVILYILIFPFVIWLLDSVNMNQIFKKDRVLQANLFYLVISICITYLLVNFMVDFFTYTRFI